MADVQKYRHLQVPFWVWQHHDLGWVDHEVYLALLAHTDAKTRCCWPGHKLLMAEAKIANKHTLINALKRLESAGAITIDKKNGYGNRYWLPKEPPETPGIRQ